MIINYYYDFLSPFFWSNKNKENIYLKSLQSFLFLVNHNILGESEGFQIEICKMVRGSKVNSLNETPSHDIYTFEKFCKIL